MNDYIDNDELDFENRIMTSSYTANDGDTEVTLRPQRLEDYIGQEKAKENLEIYIILQYLIILRKAKLHMKLQK